MHDISNIWRDAREESLETVIQFDGNGEGFSPTVRRCEAQSERGQTWASGQEMKLIRRPTRLEIALGHVPWLAPIQPVNHFKMQFVLIAVRVHRSPTTDRHLSTGHRAKLPNFRRPSKNQPFITSILVGQNSDFLYLGHRGCFPIPAKYQRNLYFILRRTGESELSTWQFWSGCFAVSSNFNGVAPGSINRFRPSLDIGSLRVYILYRAKEKSCMSLQMSSNFCWWNTNFPGNLKNYFVLFFREFHSRSDRNFLTISRENPITCLKN